MRNHEKTRAQTFRKKLRIARRTLRDDPASIPAECVPRVNSLKTLNRLEPLHEAT